MPTASRQFSDARISAVIRSYQPSRIERELLAQVFDLAQHGIQDRSTCLGAQPTTVIQADQVLADESMHDQLVEQSTHTQVEQLEVVA